MRVAAYVLFINRKDFLNIPPFKTTRRYIAKIKIYYQHYRDQAFWMFSSHYRRTLSPLSLHG